jgi:N4-gp56 family major capsid protein
MANEIVYGDKTGTGSSIGSQIRTNYYQKKALIEMKKETYFGQLADVTAMPKHMGKTIKRYHYMPLLDDANINDQGIDAAKAIVNQQSSIVVTMKDGEIPDIPPYYGRSVSNKVYFTGEGATAAAAGDAAILLVNAWMEGAVEGGGLGLTLVGGDGDVDFIDGVNKSDGLAYVKNFRFHTPAGVEYDTTANIGDAEAVMEAGNLYGSSKDIGTISGKLPTLSETGGRANRVGFTRIELEGTLNKFGFFDEYTQESMDFDTDAELAMHINREMLFGANEITEDALQIDLINGAGVVRFSGAATSVAQMSGVTATLTEVTYRDLMKLSVDLDNNRCPKQTTVITGSRMVDTKVVRAARVMYVGSEMLETLERMKDYHTNQAFVPAVHYAKAGTLINGEVGAIGHFRIVVVPEMLHKAGVGIAEGTNGAAGLGYRVTNGKYDAYPMLVVGEKSFTTIGFQTSGKSTKFTIYHKKPGEGIANLADPYGEVGFMSIKWYYGSMILRPERIALIWSVARW